MTYIQVLLTILFVKAKLRLPSNSVLQSLTENFKEFVCSYSVHIFDLLISQLEANVSWLTCCRVCNGYLIAALHKCHGSRDRIHLLQLQLGAAAVRTQAVSTSLTKTHAYTHSHY